MPTFWPVDADVRPRMGFLRWDWLAAVLASAGHVVRRSVPSTGDYLEDFGLASEQPVLEIVNGRVYVNHGSGDGDDQGKPQPRAARK